MARSFVVVAPVVDLRATPETCLVNDYSHQDGRETQLLFGEKVTLIEERGDWLKVGAIEQLRYTAAEGWHPYPGWVHRSEVRATPPPSYTHVVTASPSFSYGTWINPLHTPSEGTRPLPQAPDRAQIVADAKHFLGAPYLWGGRASPLPNTIASVDCSGLISLLYRAQGILIPRNAHDQYLASQPVDLLQPGDLLYLAKEKRINHVILNLDPTTFIEAPETGKTVRLLTWNKDVWEENGKVFFFDRKHPYTPYRRSFCY